MKITAKKLLNEETKKDFEKTNNQYRRLSEYYGVIDLEIDLPSGNQIIAEVEIDFEASSDPAEYDEYGYVSYRGNFEIDDFSWKFVENSDLIWAEYVNSGDFNENEYDQFYKLIDDYVEKTLNDDIDYCEEIYNNAYEYDGE